MERLIRRARDLGYTGVSVMHPTHVKIANDVFRPTAEEVAYFEGLLAAFEAAEKAGARSALLRQRGRPLPASFRRPSDAGGRARAPPVGPGQPGRAFSAPGGHRPALARPGSSQEHDPLWPTSLLALYGVENTKLAPATSTTRK